MNEDYPPIENHGLIGDLQTAALVSTDGTIDWMCLPRFDSPSIFASLARPGERRLFPDPPGGRRNRRPGRCTCRHADSDYALYERGWRRRGYRLHADRWRRRQRTGTASCDSSALSGARCASRPRSGRDSTTAASSPQIEAGGGGVIFTRRPACTLSLSARSGSRASRETWSQARRWRHYRPRLALGRGKSGEYPGI